MQDNNQVSVTAFVKSVMQQMNLDQPCLSGFFDFEKIEQNANTIFVAEQNILLGTSITYTEAVKKMVFRALNVEIYQALRKSDNLPLLAWLSQYLLAGLHKISKDTNNSEDAVQEALEIILTKLDTLKQPESFLYWALQIVRNALIKHYRKEASSVKIQEHLVSNYNNETLDLAESYLNQELRKILLHHINNLRPTKNTEIHQFILMNYYFNGYTVEQIAIKLKISNQKVSHLLDEAHKRLRNDSQLIQKLEDWKREGPYKLDRSRLGP